MRDADARIKKGENEQTVFSLVSTPNPIRTDNLRFRRPMLYPIELWAR